MTAIRERRRVLVAAVDIAMVMRMPVNVCGVSHRRYGRSRGYARARHMTGAHEERSDNDEQSAGGGKHGR